jgi:type I restriction enzyme S subunit
MTNYIFFKLNQICSKITDGSHYSPVGIEKGIPMLSVKDMLNNGFSYESCKYISKEDYLDLVKADCKPLVNDILIAKDGSYLKHVFVVKADRQHAILSSIGILRPNLNKVYPEYIKYYLQTKSVKETVSKKYVSGSALPRIILKNFGEIEIIEKDLSTQKKIAKVLSDLDAKIEINNKINQELEAMAKTLYDYWFVQFDFPFDFAQGKPDANGKPYKSSGGKIVFNEGLKREIPEGWEVKALESYANFKNGKGIKKDSLIENGQIPVFGSNGCIGKTENYLFNETVIAIGRVGANYGEVHYSINPCWITDNAVTSQPKMKEYLWWLLLTLKGINYSNIAGGSAQPLITQGKLKALKFPIPNNKLFQKFYEIINPIYNKINNIQEQNEKISELRDWLLPMLMNGQVSVGGVEAEMEGLGMVAEGIPKYD